MQVKSGEVLEILEFAAADQWGIITTAQAEREGVTRLQLGRLAEKDVLTRVRRGVYLLPSARYERLTDLRSAWIALGPTQYLDERWGNDDQIVVSHEAAALAHQVGDLIPDRLTFSSTTRKQTAQSDIYIYNNRAIAPEDINNIDGLPVTSVERTVYDLAVKRIELNYLATIVVEALRKEGVRYKSLAHRLDPVAPAYDFSSGRALLRACQDDAASVEDHQEHLDRLADLPMGALGTDFLGGQLAALSVIGIDRWSGLHGALGDDVTKLHQGALQGIYANSMDDVKNLSRLGRMLDDSIGQFLAESAVRGIGNINWAELAGSESIRSMLDSTKKAISGTPALREALRYGGIIPGDRSEQVEENDSHTDDTREEEE